jgi:hypothetical protein
LPIVITPHATEELSLRGFTYPHKLDTWENISFVKGDIHLNITATQEDMDHFQCQFFFRKSWGVFSTFKLKMAFVYLLYITGDTLVFDDIKEIPKRYSDIDVALLHLSGTTVMGIILTMDKKKVLKCSR